MSTMVTPRSADGTHQLHELAFLGWIGAGRGLVEQQQPRIGRQRARDLQTPLHAIGEIARPFARVLRQADEVEQLERARPDRFLFVFRPRRAQRAVDRVGMHARVPAHHDVLKHAS